MNMSEWAEQEVALACKRELGGRELAEGEFDYGCACYQSALKAYKSLCEDGHSGMSFGLTKGILNRLMDHRPLTPIKGDDDEWQEVPMPSGRTSYQCKRLGCFWKTVNDDGSITYSDNDRFYCKDIKTGVTYFSGMVSDVVNEMFPIELPYWPDSKPMVVNSRDLLTDRKHGDFDTVGIFSILKNGESIPVNRFFKEDGDGWEEISREEWDERERANDAREKAEAENEEGK